MATRKHPGVGQRTIVDQTKIGESGYFKIENGRTKLDLQELFEVLGLLEISPEELFKDINYT
jgi:transcriptional regulator with XRE-family HTH domain